MHQELNEMGFDGFWLHISLRSLCTMPGIGWSGVKHAGTGLCSNENVMNLVSLFGSQIGVWWMTGKQYLPECMDSLVEEG